MGSPGGVGGPGGIGGPGGMGGGSGPHGTTPGSRGAANQNNGSLRRTPTRQDG